jgi:hypothetical protein
MFQKKNLILLFLIAWPFIFLMPFTLKFLQPGNDFELYYFVYKKYIFEFLKIGHLPLWSPAEGSGYSLVFNPLSQYFYPVSWVYYSFSFIVGELNTYTFTIYTISALSIFNIGTYFFLKSYNLSTKIIIISTLIVCSGLRLTELIKFPNALHAAAWFPWVLLGINHALLKKNYLKKYLLIFISTFMIFTAGYPYFIFYSFIMCLIYFLFFLIKKYKVLLFTSNYDSFDNNKKYFLNCIIPASLSFLICSPYLLKINQLMKFTNGRSENEIGFSLTGSASYYDHIGSWFYPPIATADGWYYFGISVSFIIILFLTSKFNYKQISTRLISILFLFFLFFAVQLSNVKESLIFGILWDLIPPIRNIRYWEKFTIILMPIFTLIIAHSLQFSNHLKNIINKENKKYLINILLIFIFLSFVQIYFINFSDYESIFWNRWQAIRLDYLNLSLLWPFNYIPILYKHYVYLIFLIIFFIFFIIYLKEFQITKNLFFFKNFCYVVIFFSITELFLLSNIQWAIPYNYYQNSFEKLGLVKNYNKFNPSPMRDLNLAFDTNSVSNNKSGSPIHQGNMYYRNNKKFNPNIFNNWGMKNHILMYSKYFDQNGKFKENFHEEIKNKVKIFYALSNNKRIFFTENINYSFIQDFVNEAEIFEKKSNFLYEKKVYTGDVLEINLNIDKDGWLTFVDNWDPNWEVYVNSKKKKIEKLFGSYKSVKIEQGFSTVRFTYNPFNLNFTKEQIFN